MTNNELLQADMLDILFDGRNKDYGAYALRRGYNKRMLLSLATGFSLIALFILLNSFSKKNISGAYKIISGDSVILIAGPTIEIMPPKPTPVPKTRVTIPPPSLRVVPPVIVPDDQVPETAVPTTEDMNGKQISDVTEDGRGNPENLLSTGTGSARDIGTMSEVALPIYMPLPSSNPEFPGGIEALRKFLGRHLQTPEELEEGSTKVVRARFRVDKEGIVSLVEIETSAGALYDQEVIRVCKKMPRWKPAIQNGEPVSVSYVLPVTFITQ